MKYIPATACFLWLLSACASHQADHFYILNVNPERSGEPRTPHATQAILKVALPSIVDRPEMVLNTSSDGVAIFEHERWAVSLGDLVTQTLAQDIERRRTDLFIAGNSTQQNEKNIIKVMVDVVQITLRQGSQASIETHWKIVDMRTGKEVVGADTFRAPLGKKGYAVIAQALSECIANLADRLAEKIPVSA